METKIKKCCPNCSQLYHLKPMSSKSIPNIPLFLDCGHSMCETCVRNILKFGEPIQCKICLQDMQVSTEETALLMENKISLYKLFPFNVYMIGELTLQDFEPKDANKASTDNEYYIDIKSLIKNTEITQGECLECHGPTTTMCRQCDIILCNNCFNKTHKNFIIFKNHSLQNIEVTTQKTTCKIHKDKPLDYYCKECTKSICMDCMMVGGEKSCKNHNVTSIQEMNETFLSDIAELTPKADEILKRLTKTAVEIGNILTKNDDELTSSEYMTLLNNIEQHFSKINSIIQKQKDQITHKLLELKNTEKESLTKAKSNVAEAIKKANVTLNTIKLLDSNKMIQLNMAALLEDLKQIINSPWHLRRDEPEIKMNVSVKEDVYPLLSDYIKLEGDANPKYKLYTTAELTEKKTDIPAAPNSIVYPPEVIKDVRQLNKQKPKEHNTEKHTFVKNVPTYRSNKSGSCSSLNSNNSDFSYKSYLTYEQYRPQVEPVSPFPESERPNPLYEGAQELIYVSHIVDPHNLYVQRASQQGRVQELLREFRNAVSSPKPSTGHVAEGKIYLVYNKADKLWQRGRVVSIDRRDQNKPLFRVFCIDFGSTEVVSVDKLRLLPPARIQSPPPFAINCCLANCDPIQGSWTSDDSFLIQKIIDNKRAVIHVRHVSATECGSIRLECDITTFDDGVSIAHALAFHGRAKIPKNMSYPKMMTLTEKPKLFINSSDYKKNTVEEVYITHILNPGNFFVRKRHLQNVFEKLCDELNEEYSLGVNNASIYLPEKNMVCVANVEKCSLGASLPGAWARAVVLELPGRGRVRLLLPDTGAQVLLHWSALRRIHTKFTVLKALATECHLAGVIPMNKKWSPASVELLEKFKNRFLELHVEESRNRGSLGVTLYDKSDEENVICVNTQMIKYKYAYTFGIYMFNKNNDMDDLVYDNKSPLDEPKPRRKPKDKDDVTILKRNHPLPVKPKVDDLNAKDKGPLRLEAKVLNYQSPSLIYVSLVHQQKVFNELFEKIQKYYTTNKTQGKEDWKVGDRCCTVCAQSQTWRRAAILALENDHAKVFYSDFACVETVPIAGLREMPAEFASVGDAAIMCHLAGVIPAGGDEWPSISKEYLKDLLDVYKRVFITKLGEFKDKSMPVELWVYHTTTGGALEPNISEWRCLNRRIVEQGLAIPDNSEQAGTSSDIATAKTGDDMLSFLNITGSVRDWLQIEPIPMKPLTVKPDKPESETTTSQSSTPVSTDKEDPQSSNTIFISDWLPAEPLSTDEFTAMPTYIDNDGVIYLHDISQQDTLDLIRKALDVRFKDPDPKAKFYKWTVGEPCIALFFLDNRFYRGRVLEVNNDTSTCLIHYIDYGNEEMCSFENLRKSIALHQIPVQAHKCVLNGIRPVGKNWDQQTLDYIHKSVVEKQCYVKVSGEPIGDLIPIDLKFDKLWINEHLVDFEMAVYKDGTKAVVRKFAPIAKERIKVEEPIESDSGPDYIVESDDYLSQSSESQVSVQMRTLDIVGKDWNELMQEEEEESAIGSFVTFPPFTETEFLCNITELNEKNKFELTVVQDHETSVMYKNMYAQLQSESHETALDGIYDNKACLALFPEDGQWYRATIQQYSKAKKLIKVKYIDYGNMEVLELNNVREISDEYLKLPPATVTATLHGIQINPALDVKTVAEKLANTFLDKDPFHVKVIKHDVIPSVELRDVDGNLIYDNLIKEKVFINID